MAFNFFDTLKLVFELQIGPVLKFVLFAILCRVNKKTGFAWPSTSTLAKMTGYTRSTVISAIKQLEQLGHITVVRSIGKGNKYIVHPSVTQTGPADEPDLPSDRASMRDEQDLSSNRSETYNNINELAVPGLDKLSELDDAQKASVLRYLEIGDFEMAKTRHDYCYKSNQVAAQSKVVDFQSQNAARNRVSKAS